MFQEPQGSREAPSTAIRGSVELGERPAVSGAPSHAGEPSRTAVLTQMRRKAGVTAAKGKDTCVSGLGSVPGLHVRPAANHACRAAARAGLGPGGRGGTEHVRQVLTGLLQEVRAQSPNTRQTPS